jgi:hypothetical protein
MNFGHHPWMMRRLVSLTTLLLLLAGASTAGCGSTRSGNQPSASPSASPSAKVPGAEDLKKGLLQLSDMPTGYAAKPGSTSGGGTPSPADSSSVTGPNAACTQLFNQFDQESSTNSEQASASAEFEKAATGPFVKEELESYRDAAALQKDMGTVSAAVDKCGEFTVKEEDGEAKVKMANASFPKLGDETAAFKLDALVSAGGKRVTLSGYLIAVRVGNVVCTITSFGVPNVDANEIEQITRKAVDKVTPIAR